MIYRGNWWNYMGFSHERAKSQPNNYVVMLCSSEQKYKVQIRLWRALLKH